MDSLRRAWARSWIPGTIRAGRFPDIPGAVEAVPASVLSGRDRPGLAKSLDAEVDPESLEKVLDRAEALLSARAPADPAILEEARESLVLVRYAAGRVYNQDVRTNDPYEFLVRIDSPDPGDPGPGVLLGLVRRSFELEERLVRAAGSPAASRRAASPQAAGLPSAGKGADGSEAGRAFGPRDRPVEASRVRQVTGSPSSPGRAAGTAVRPGSRSSGDGRVGVAAGRGAADGSPPFVLLCDRLTRDLLAAFPDAAAAAERDGGRVGLGARLARSAGLPCVSGVRDLDRVPEGTRVGVDGDLGIVSLETVR